LNSPIPINIAVEDELSEVVVRKLLSTSGLNYAIGVAFNRGGAIFLKKKIPGFNNASKGCPWLLLTDLDQTSCAPTLIREWLPQKPNPNLIFRVAVREVESWILADREGFSRYLGVSPKKIPLKPDSVTDPKALVIELAKKCRKRELRDDIVPPNTDRKIGPNYNGRLIHFVHQEWQPNSAKNNSDSLNSTIIAIKQFKPTLMNSVR